MASEEECDRGPEQVVAPVRSRRWAVIAVAAFGVAVLVYVLAVWTVTGQALENAALRGADQVDLAQAGEAWRALDEITVYSLAAAVVLIALVGALRRRWDLAVAAVGVVVLGQVVVQGLKRFVLVRPPLVEVTGDYTHNSLPSGHTAIAMTVLFAAVIVAPHRWRGVVMLFLLPWAVGIGQYTLTAKWHRLSDTLAADAIALALAALASWWLARRGALHRYEGRRRVGRVVIGAFAVVSAVVGLVLGGVLWGVPLARAGLAGVVRDHDYEWDVYLGAGSFALAGSLVAALVFLASWRRLAT
ncbi:phosphatase PAP2 family protein [Saccharothrix sp. S26]|uniref:phosphatase PAP2 family protein n=1 Tax=Saccharothrix sp. S26 TaxID=2907215 RepID=UPI001F33623A|nr:phosphatase PAP2 family protein [Saccharothrix sp. S26]MCE6995421.1 phosphatase PAP2 family protein [Saccharothrix sp. S26]